MRIVGIYIVRTLALYWNYISFNTCVLLVFKDIVSFAVEDWFKEDEEFDFAKGYQKNEIKPVNCYRFLDARKKQAAIA